MRKSSAASEITCEDLEKMMVEGKVPIIDVRRPDELENGKIVGSINIEVDKVKEAFSLDPETFQREFGAEKPNPESTVVFHCQLGRRGANATLIAQELGYTRALNLKGGFQQWKGED
ncbi:thiosulfate:glutathione sulfurtransferase-like isoform X1 [Hypanus sabinus]|uniref:thiosulfate:glutathione sulfurtransferase-like isoform X1 n=1 Tax=Hypanus sabinus TaxID=79690 RepID=UPI0028C3B129|nr:thiosulfate:glutathione sulfurtransferase-like isoform X1 [Hypanus sabinus]